MKLLFVGDVMLGRLVNQTLSHVSPAYPWGDTLPLFQQADTCICNLECVLSDHGSPRTTPPKAFHFRSDAKNVAVLKTAGITAVSLANNHVLDFGDEALLDMLELLDAAGIHHAGAGRNQEEACAPAIIQSAGMRIGLLASTDNEPEWAATSIQPGVCYTPIELHDERSRHFLEQVRCTREQVDLLIVSLHWGPNWGFIPPPGQIPFAHALVDAGAQIIFGHSGHIVRGIELYKGCPILYCTGDFIDDYAIDPAARNDLSFVFILELANQHISRLLLYPTCIQHFQARRAERPERDIIVSGMQQLCSALHTNATWQEQEQRLVVPVSANTGIATSI